MKKSKKNQHRISRIRQRRKILYPEYRNQVADDFFFKLGYVRIKRGEKNPIRKTMY